MTVGIVQTHTVSTLKVEVQPVKATVNNQYFNCSYISVWSCPCTCCLSFLYLHKKEELDDKMYVDV